MDIDSGSVVGTIPHKLGVQGVALATELGKGFLSDGKAEKVTIFDLKTLKPIADVAAGQKTGAIIFDSATGRVFAFNGESNSATVIDAETGKVAGTVDLGWRPRICCG
jgi:YVTN family beta-propeller protein